MDQVTADMLKPVRYASKAATNRNLKDEAEAGRFRIDLHLVVKLRKNADPWEKSSFFALRTQQKRFLVIVSYRANARGLVVFSVRAFESGQSHKKIGDIMGKKMAKSSVIYGAGGNVKAKGFNDWKQVEELILGKIGRAGKYDLSAAKKALTNAENDKKMKIEKAYIKIGVVAGDLVMRIKEEKTLGDIEHDATLVTGYDAAVKFAEGLEKALGTLRINYYEAIIKPLQDFDKLYPSFEKGMNVGDLEEATKQLTSLGQKVNRAEELHNQAGYKAAFNEALKEGKIEKEGLKNYLEANKPFEKEVSAFDLKFSDTTKRLKGAKKAWEELMQKVSEDLDQPAKDDQEYKKEFNVLMSSYKKVVDELTKNSKAAEVLLKAATKFKDTADTVEASVDFVDGEVMKCFKKVKQLEADNAESFNQIRENKDISGKPSLKKQVNEKMTTEDINKKFGVLHSKAAVINQELIVTKREIQKECIFGLKAYVKRFGKDSKQGGEAMIALGALVKK